MKIKLALIALVLATFLAAPVHASSITITLDQTVLSGKPGDTLKFFGSIENTGSDTIYFNSVDLNLAGSSFSTNYFDFFFNNVPISLDPGNSSADIELFDVTLLNPFTDPLGSYTGTYTLFGGADGGTMSAQDNLAQANFTVAAVPEPASGLLLLTGLAVLAFLKRSSAARSR